MEGKRYFLAAMFLAVLILPFIGIEGGGQQVELPPPTFNIRIYDSSYETEHHLSGDVTSLKLDVSGDVTFILPEGVPPTTECQLSIQIDCRYLNEDTRKYFYFDLETKYDTFSFDNFIEGFYPAGSGIGFTITGSWEYMNDRGSGKIDPITGNISVTPYSFVSIDTGTGSSQVSFGSESWKEIDVIVYNRGNARDTITISAKRANYHEIIIKEKEITLGPQETATIVIRIKPRTFDIIDEYIYLNFKGSYDNWAGEKELRLRVRSVYVEDKKEESRFPFPWIMILMAIPFIILAVILFLHRYEKKKEKEAEIYEAIEEDLY